jgi:hypothetical protein
MLGEFVGVMKEGMVNGVIHGILQLKINLLSL